MNDEKIRCLVVDDEPIGREIVEGFIAQTAGLQLVASCEDAFEALNILQRQQVDLLFSDIQMPRVNGLDLVRSLTHSPVIIFITAHSNFAVDSYNLDITDYLLKPVAYQRFLKAVNKAVLHIKALQKQNPGAITGNACIFLKTTNKLNKILINDIVYAEAQKDYIKIVCTDKKNLIVHSSMKTVEEKLPAGKFFRIHKSYLVALGHIKSISGNTVELSNGASLIMAKVRKEELYKALNIAGEM